MSAGPATGPSVDARQYLKQAFFEFTGDDMNNILAGWLKGLEETGVLPEAPSHPKLATVAFKSLPPMAPRPIFVPIYEEKEDVWDNIRLQKMGIENWSAVETMAELRSRHVGMSLYEFKKTVVMYYHAAVKHNKVDVLKAISSYWDERGFPRIELEQSAVKRVNAVFRAIWSGSVDCLRYILSQCPSLVRSKNDGETVGRTLRVAWDRAQKSKLTERLKKLGECRAIVDQAQAALCQPTLLTAASVPAPAAEGAKPMRAWDDDEDDDDEVDLSIPANVASLVSSLVQQGVSVTGIDAEPDGDGAWD